MFRSAARFTNSCLYITTLLVAFAAARSPAAEIGAVTSGNWNVGSTWTGGTAPGAADNAYIGSTFPAGSASSATVTLTANQSVGSVTLGFDTGTAGTLNLGTFRLTTGSLQIGSSSGTGSVLRTTGSVSSSFVSVFNTTFNITAADAISQLQLNNASTTIAAGASVSGLVDLDGTSTLTTTASGNLTGQVRVGVNAGSTSTLILGADLINPASNVSVSAGSTINAQGRNLTAGSIQVDGTLSNRGTLTTSQLYVSGQSFNLTSADAVQIFNLTDASTALTAGVVVSDLYLYGNSTTSTATTANVAQSVSLNGTSTLTLNANLNLSSVDVQTGATLNAQNRTITASDVNLAGTLSNRSTLTTQNLSVGGQAFSLTAADTVSGTYTLYSNASSTLGSSVVVNSLSVTSGADAVTTATGNVATSISADGAGSTITLGANFSGPAGGVTITGGGAVNAQNNTISTGSAFLSGLGTTLQNAGSVTSTGIWQQQSGPQVTLAGGDNSFGNLSLSTNTRLNVTKPGTTAGLTITESLASGISIDGTSRLTLTLDRLTPGTILRWANPVGGGNHIADLNSLISLGRIDFLVLNGSGSNIFADANFTYIVPIPEPAAMLVVAAGGLAAVRLRRKRHPAVAA